MVHIPPFTPEFVCSFPHPRYVMLREDIHRRLTVRYYTPATTTFKQQRPKHKLRYPSENTPPYDFPSYAPGDGGCMVE
jgi:hypothetical protein